MVASEKKFFDGIEAILRNIGVIFSIAGVMLGVSMSITEIIHCDVALGKANSMY